MCARKIAFKLISDSDLTSYRFAAPRAPKINIDLLVRIRPNSAAVFALNGHYGNAIQLGLQQVNRNVNQCSPSSDGGHRRAIVARCEYAPAASSTMSVVTDEVSEKIVRQ